MRQFSCTAFAKAALAVAGIVAWSTPAVANIYLNGIDISSARSQELKNVTVTINENGDIFIIAPHYQVNEEDTFVPLSKFVQGLSLPVHKKPTQVGASLMKVPKEPGTAQGLAPEAAATAPLEKLEEPPPSMGDPALQAPVDGSSGTP